MLEPISWLAGTWKGQGCGGFPTMDDFEFEDEMRIKTDLKGYVQEPLIHFEEMAWVLDKEEKRFMHWETGYFKPDQDGRIQFYICHNTGRIEITYGKFEVLNSQNKSFEIHFNSEFIRNDKGTKFATKSNRKIILQDDTLTYSLAMSTEDVSEMNHHLTSKLMKVK